MASPENRGSSQRNFAFINALPVTDSEREHSRLVVRSHSAQYGQRQRQKNWEESSKKSAEAVPSPGSLPSKSLKHVKHHSRPSRAVPSSTPHLIAADETGKFGKRIEYNIDVLENDRDDIEDSSGTSSGDQEKDSHRTQKDSSSAIKSTIYGNAVGLRRPGPEAAGTLIGRISHFGAASFDPFSTLYRTPLPEALLSESISYLLSEVVPAMVPHEDENPLKPVTHQMFELCRDDPAFFYSSLFGALCHRQMRDLKNENGIVAHLKRNTYFARYSKFEAVRLLRRALKSGDYWCSDAALFTVMSLGCHEWEEKTEQIESKSFFRQPLASLQSLDVYGSLSQDPVHLQALFRLIEARGGIGTVKLPGLAAAVCYGDILMASRFGTKPLLPFIPLINSISCTLEARLNFDTSDVKRDFNRYETVGLTYDICEILEAIKIYQDCIEQYAYGGDLLKARYIDQRNLIQHYVVSLTALETVMDSKNWENIIYEGCRLALQIYSSTLVFPLRPNSPVLEYRLAELYELLSKHYKDIPKESILVLELLSWIVTIAGIAAAFKPPLRTYFVGLLKDLSPLLPAPTFDTLKSKSLNKILWLESACDTAGQALWDEI